MEVTIKRAYDVPDQTDGYRVLVDRLWPRGVTKDSLRLDEWCKNVAPSSELRHWFDHDPAKFEEFSERYTEELRSCDVPKQLLERVKGSRLTLIYAAKDPQVNHAVILRQYLQKLLPKN